MSLFIKLTMITLLSWQAWALSTTMVSAEEIIVNSYYGKYDAGQKESGFPSGSQSGPVKEKWITPKPEKKYHIGVLLPHLKDPYWKTANYGIVKYAEKVDIKITLHEAGGYIHFGNQKQQLLSFAKEKNVDGVILASVDYLKMDRFVAEASGLGMPVVGLINDIHAPAIAAKAMVSYFDAGYKAGEFVVKDSLNKDIRIAFFPGPEKSGWAKDMYDGFMAAVSELKEDGRSVTVLAPLYGDTRPEVQRMRLGFLLNRQENHRVDYIIGNAVAALEAVTYLKNNKNMHPNAKIVSTYLTPPLYDFIKKGDIRAAPYDQTIIICQIALDMMVRLLNGDKPGKDFPFRAGPDYVLITTDNIAENSYEKLFGDRNY